MSSRSRSRPSERPRNVRAPSEHGCVAPRTAGDRHPRVGRERHPSDDASNRSVAASPQIQRPSGRRRRSSRDREHLAPVKTRPGRIDGADVRPAGADLGRRRQDPWVHGSIETSPSDLPLKTSTLPCSCAEASARRLYRQTPPEAADMLISLGGPRHVETPGPSTEHPLGAEW